MRELLGEIIPLEQTIQTVAERNAYGYVKGYLEDRGIQARSAMIERLAKVLKVLNVQQVNTLVVLLLFKN